MIIASYSCRVPLPPIFVNASGSIQNLVERECGGVAIIRSKAGARRSSHHHRTDFHYLYVLSGKMHYRERAVGSDTVVAFTVEAGQMVYTPPMVDHWTTFDEDTVMISVTRLSGESGTHEADLVHVPWLEET